MEEALSLRLLGQIQVELDGKTVHGFELRKVLAMLCYLAQHDQPISRSHLSGFAGARRVNLTACDNSTHFVGASPFHIYSWFVHRAVSTHNRSPSVTNSTVPCSSVRNTVRPYSA